MPAAGGRTPRETLERLTRRAAAERYPAGIPDDIRRRLDHELALIDELDFAPYFLTVRDIVAFARERGVLCQGRRSAANSTVCFVLGITAVGPGKVDLLFERFVFERFVSAERGEPPDVDFDHERREEVIQYVYARWGRERAGLAATVIRYRTRSALRDVGKATGLGADAIDALGLDAAGHLIGAVVIGVQEAAACGGRDPDDPVH